MHLGHCHHYQCAISQHYQATVINTPSTIVYQKIPDGPNILIELNKKFNDYYYDMEFVVRKIRNLIEFITKYHKLYKYSEFVKEIYQKQSIRSNDYIVKREGLENQNIALYISALQKIEVFYIRIQTKKIILQSDRSYCNYSYFI